jgi:hypothetical protein
MWFDPIPGKAKPGIFVRMDKPIVTPEMAAFKGEQKILNIQ